MIRLFESHTIRAPSGMWGLFDYFEIGSPYKAHSSLRLLPQLPSTWNYKVMPFGMAGMYIFNTAVGFGVFFVYFLFFFLHVLLASGVLLMV